jgi:hypothetical protein
MENLKSKGLEEFTRKLKENTEILKFIKNKRNNYKNPVNFATEVIMPLARSYNYKINLEDFAIYKNKRMLKESELEEISGGITRKIFAGLALGIFLSPLVGEFKDQAHAFNIIDDILAISQDIIKDHETKYNYLSMEECFKKIISGKIAPKNEAVRKLALLWQQYEEFINDPNGIGDKLEEIENKYIQEVDKANSNEEILKFMQKIQSELSTSFPNFGCLIYLKHNSPENPPLTEKYAMFNNNYYFEILGGLPEEMQKTLGKNIGAPEISQDIDDVRLCYDSSVLDSLKLIQEAFSENVPKLKENIKKCINSFFERYFYDFSDPSAKKEIFVCAVGFASQKINDIFIDLCEGDIDGFLQECSTEVKNSFTEIINETDKLVDSSKTKVKNLINKIPVNGKIDNGDTSINELDGLYNFELKDNFWESIIALRNSQKEAVSRKTDEFKKSTIKKCISNIGALSLSGGPACVSNTDPQIKMALHDKAGLAWWENLSKAPGFAEHFNISQRELFKWMTCATMAHEMGHALDRILGTSGRKDNLIISQEEKDNIIIFKNDLVDHSRKKAQRHIVPLKSPPVANEFPANQWNPSKSVNEIFADYLSYDALYRALTRNYLPEQQQEILKIVSYSLSLAIFSKDNLDQSDGIHPPDKIRYDSIVGLFDWLYDLGIEINENDLAFTTPENRIKF